MSSPAQIRAIQTLRRQTGIDDGDYRALLALHGGEASWRDLPHTAALRVIDALRQLPGAGPAPARSSAFGATGRYAPMLRELWHSAYDLGLARQNHDAALVRFVRRQTGLWGSGFLTYPDEAHRAIEALKGWMTRDGGVVWPSGYDVLERRWAICRAVAVRLQAAMGEQESRAWVDLALAVGTAHDLPSDIDDYSYTMLLRLTNLLGERLRARLVLRERGEGR